MNQYSSETREQKNARLEREMAEVREFMPEEMGRRSVQTFLPITRDNEMMSELERRVQSVKSAPPGLQRRSALQLLRDAAEKAGMPDAATKSLADISNFVREMKVRNKDSSYSGSAA